MSMSMLGLRSRRPTPKTGSATAAAASAVPSSETGAAVRSADTVALTQKLKRFFDSYEGDFVKQREVMFEEFKKPLFTIPPMITDDEYRDLTIRQIKHMCDLGFVKVGDLRDNARRFFKTLEMFGHISGSMGIKTGVQFILWGGSVLFLGTEKHHEKYLRDFDTLKTPGCFAMTELGHGSNVRGLVTTATYDAKTQEFVINSPSEAAAKWWIGNAAVHGKFATVFVDLIVEGVSHGIHAVVVPLRDAEHKLLPGVSILDCGHKIGLNGIDNGVILFNNVRVPRDNLLNRFADVSPDGVYSSSIKNAGKRFATVLSALVGGRVGLIGGSLVSLNNALTIAIRYAHARRQFGPPRGGEIPIMEYPTHQLRLMPLLAQYLAMFFSSRYVVDRYATRTDDDIGDVHVLASGFKAVTTWLVERGIQTCRECCGGHGYHDANRFGRMRADVDVFLTFEGDNHVLLQQVAQSLLSQYKSFFAEHPYTGVFMMLRDRMVSGVKERNPLKTHRYSERHLLSPEFHLAVFDYRVNRLLYKLARQLRAQSKRLGPFNAWNESMPDTIQLAKAFVHKVCLEQFQNVVRKCDVPEARSVLQLACNLYALHNIWEDIGTFRQLELIKRTKAAAISEEVRSLCKELAGKSLALVDAICAPDHVLKAPLGQSDLDPGAHMMDTVRMAVSRL